MEIVGNGKESKLNKDRSLLNYSGKAFNQERVGILEVVFLSDTRHRFLPPQTFFSLSVT